MGFKSVPRDDITSSEIPLMMATTKLSTSINSKNTISSHKDICSAIDSIGECAKDLSESGDRVRIAIEIIKPTKE